MYLTRLKRAVVFTALFLFCCSCDQLRVNRAFDLAVQSHYQAAVIKTSGFPVQVFYQARNSRHAVIYLEGDGLVINKYGEVARNSTPTDPMALKLACVDKRDFTKIVVNRPFHYLKCENPDCKYWTTARYAPEVIQSILDVIATCKEQLHFETIEFVAYSGGACIALLLAPHLENIIRIVSFAGNLDHKSWTNYHHTEPLSLSLDPMKNQKVLSKIPQIHFLGTSDKNTPLALGFAYQQRINSSKISIIPIEDFDHDSNWPNVWKEQLAKLK